MMAQDVLRKLCMYISKQGDEPKQTQQVGSRAMCVCCSSLRERWAEVIAVVSKRCVGGMREIHSRRAGLLRQKEALNDSIFCLENSRMVFHVGAPPKKHGT